MAVKVKVFIVEEGTVVMFATKTIIVAMMVQVIMPGLERTRKL